MADILIKNGAIRFTKKNLNGNLRGGNKGNNRKAVMKSSRDPPLDPLICLRKSRKISLLRKRFRFLKFL